MVADGQRSVARPLTGLIYQRRGRRTDLRQGDLLTRTAKLERILSDHPPFSSPEYRHFLVLTQSCDLVRRSGVCSAKRVCLAGVKDASETVANELSDSQLEIEREGKFTKERDWNRLQEFLIRLLNNNEQGLFFLPREMTVAVSDHLCAFLALTVTLDSKHYGTCVAARIVGIKEVFQAKLGWLVGGMYSRVGTPDLSEFLSNDEASRLRRSLIVDNVQVYKASQHTELLASLAEDPLPEVNAIAVAQRAVQLGLNLDRKTRVTQRMREILMEQREGVGLSPAGTEKLLRAFRTDRVLERMIG